MLRVCCKTSGMNLRRSRWLYGALPVAALVGLLGAVAGLAYPASSHASPLAGSCSQYALAPTISGLTPSSGKVGAKVVVTGNHFTGNSQIASVTFAGGTSATFKLRSKTRLTVRVPSGASTGGITLTNCAGHATTATFTVQSIGCVVPKVTGKSLGAAKAAIATAHCTTGKVTKVKSSKKKGTVIKQSPRAGKHLAAKSKVSLTVSKGK